MVLAWPNRLVERPESYGWVVASRFWLFHNPLRQRGTGLIVVSDVPRKRILKIKIKGPTARRFAGKPAGRWSLTYLSLITQSVGLG